MGKHKWGACGMCGTMVRCGLCGNNSCNSGSGYVWKDTGKVAPFDSWDDPNATRCPGCPSAYQKMMNGTPPANVRKRARIARMRTHRNRARSAAQPANIQLFLKAMV